MPSPKRATRAATRYCAPMDLREVDRRFGGRRKWVWSAQPRFVFDEDGNERPDFEAVEDVGDEAFEDETGWWTCHPDTKAGDLAVIYRSSGNKDPNFPVRGPKDLAYVALVTSEPPFALDRDPFAIKQGLADKYGCHCVIVAKIEPSVGLGELRADPVLRDWPALKASFVRAAMPMPEDVWRRFVEIAASDERSAPPRRPRRRRLSTIERRYLERELEDWLTESLSALRSHGLDLELVGRQVYCEGHEGTMDVLCRRAGGRADFVVLELKVDEVRRDAVGQILGYLGWLRSRPEVSEATGVLIGGWQHPQVPYALAEVDAKVQWISWDAVDLPADLRHLHD